MTDMSQPLEDRSPEYIETFNREVHAREPNDDPPNFLPAAPAPEDFTAAWASKCEELARETAKVTALIGVIRGVVETSRPGTTKAQRDEAWAAVGAITLLDEARADEDFMARLARVREEYSGR